MTTPNQAAAILRKIGEALQLANDDENGPITDTIWMPGVGCQTLFDYIAEEIEVAERAAIQPAGDAFCEPCQGTGMKPHYLGGLTNCLDCSSPNARPAPAAPVQAAPDAVLREALELTATWIESIQPDNLELWRDTKVADIRRALRTAPAVQAAPECLGMLTECPTCKNRIADCVAVQAAPVGADILPHPDCDAACHYHCTEAGAHPPECVTGCNHIFHKWEGPEGETVCEKCGATPAAPKVKASELPPLPFWLNLENLGGLVPSAIQREVHAYGQACIAADRAARSPVAAPQPLPKEPSNDPRTKP